MSNHFGAHYDFPQHTKLQDENIVSQNIIRPWAQQHVVTRK